MGEFIRRHKLYWTERAFLLSSFWAVIILGASVWINTLANNYAILTGKIPVTDIILSNVPVFDVDVLVNYGPVIIIAAIFIIFLFRPAAIPFTLKTLGLFIVTRALFMSLTHIGQFTPQLAFSSNDFFTFLGGGNSGGLFFSGHTGVPFLLALIFWKDKWLRYGFIALSVLLGTAMLLAHLHYSIDILGAFFITPTIYRLAEKFFKHDHARLSRGF